MIHTISSPMTNLPESITPADLQQLLACATPPVLLDVREKWERDIALLRDSFHIPLSEVVQRMPELPLAEPIVVFCHHGGRSGRAASWLRQNGYDATNLEGGIDAWAAEIDPSIPRY